MSTKWAITFLCALALVKAQNGYSRDSPSNQLGYNSLGQSISDDDQSNGEEIPGEAGRDYPAYDKVPDTGFSCNNQQYPGYYADPESQCQAFYICQKSGRGASFLCPTGSIFNQESLVCDWWYNVDCSRAEEKYSVNEQVSRAMEEADARQSEQQQQGGYNYDNPETSGNGDSGQYNQGPSSTYGVPSMGNKNSGFNQNGQGSNGQNELSKISSVYGVPGQTRDSPFGQSQNGFSGTGSNIVFNGRQNGNRPSQSYGVPSSNNASGQRYTSNGNGDGRYNGNEKRFNGNTPKPVYGPPAGGRNGNDGNAQSTESFNGFNGKNGNSQVFRNSLRNAPSNFGGNRLSNGNAPSSQYGVPAQENGFNGSGLSGKGIYNGATPGRSYLPSSK